MRIFVLFFCIAMYSTSFAQITPRNLLGNKYTFEDIRQSLIAKSSFKPYPKTPKEWLERVPHKTIIQLIQQGEEALEYVFQPISGTLMMEFQRSGTRSKHRSVSYVKRNKLVHMILAESIEGKGRFTEAIFNGVWSICEESYWGVPAHISRTGLPDVNNPYVDLHSAETAAVLALADYFVGDKLDLINPQIRKRIYVETDKRIFSPLLNESNKYGYMSKTEPVNNWNPWIMSNWLMSSLLLESDELRRQEMAYHSMLGLDSFFNSLGEDGGSDEGPSYWFGAGGSATDYLDLMKKSTSGRIDIFDELLIQNMSSYIYKTHISDRYFVTFADSVPSMTPDGLLLYRIGEAIKNEPLSKFGQWAHHKFGMRSTDGFMRMRMLENLMSLQKVPKKNGSLKNVPYAWFGDIQVLVARNRYGLFLATHGGHNAESHNHNDVGDFIIYQDGQPMIIDAGRGNYTAKTFTSERYNLWFTRSDHHNVPLINGMVQEEGRQYRAVDVEPIDSPKVYGLRMSLKDAYPGAAGVQKWKRVIVIEKNHPEIRLTDSYSLEKAESLKQVFMTVCEVLAPKPGTLHLKSPKGAVLELKYNPDLWGFSMEKPSAEGKEYNSFKKKWGGASITRIVFVNKKLKVEDKYTFNFKKLR